MSCPCDLNLWRKHMKELRPKSRVWDMKIESLSPIEELNNIDESTQIVTVHGENDEIVPINIASRFVKELKANNKKVKFVILENQGHEIAFDKKIFEMIKELVE